MSKGGKWQPFRCEQLSLGEGLVPAGGGAAGDKPRDEGVEHAGHTACTALGRC